MKIFHISVVVVCFLATAQVSVATYVSGNVSGVWSVADSPYYVTADVTIPVGQLLEILPGVQVLFTGHCRFNVNGNLQATGTEQDSIVFTRAYSTEESKWWGIRFSDSASDNSRLEYCTVEYSSKENGNDWDTNGGGIYITRCSPTISRCTIRNCAGSYGAGICVLEESNAVIECCLIRNNTSSSYGGGVWLGSTACLRNCTLVGNTAPNGNGIGCGIGSPTIHNTILWDGIGEIGHVEETVTVSFSNIMGGYAGEGNINADPLFADPAHGDFHLDAASPCIDSGDPSSPFDPDGTVADMGAFCFIQCLPTEFPFVDSFDSSELGSCWFWIREDTSHWSLSERPGWMRIESNGNFHQPQSNTTKNILLRAFPDGNMVIQSRLDYTGDGYTGAGLMFYKDDDNFVDIMRIIAPPAVMRSHNHINNIGQNLELIADWNPVHLRIAKVGNTYTTWASPDSIVWSFVAQWTNDLSSSGLVRCGLYAIDSDQNLYHAEDFDYLRVDTLPGTAVCGDVSGVWDLAGSPYYVTCDVTVPTGQALDIQPGAQVLFTGLYGLTVNGSMSAVGSISDTILFSSADPGGGTQWNGIDVFSDQASCTLAFCQIEYSAHAGFAAGNSAHIEVSDCILTNNTSSGTGAGAYFGRCTGTVVRTHIIGNSTTYLGGGIMFQLSPSPIFDDCLIANNWAGVEAGAVFMNEGATPLFRNCTFANNSNPNNGTIHVWGATGTFQSCIIFFSSAQAITTDGGTALVSYSDIQGGYSGTGNINEDPLFIDAENGDYHLQASSPCIDTGDSASPLDPDGSRADMGAFPYSGPRFRITSPNGGEQWTLFTTDTVRWDNDEYEGAVFIELTRNYPDGPWDSVVIELNNDGKRAVFVDEPISDHCRFRVTALEDELVDVSDGDFSIVPSEGYLALVRPAQQGTAVLSWNAGTIECPNVVLETLRLKNFGDEAIAVYRPEALTSPAFSRITTCPTSFTLQAGEMSTCDVTLNFAPEGDGTYWDTLRVRTNASNAVDSYVRIPLIGTQVSTPATPEVVIAIQGENAQLTWNRITESVGACPIEVTRYLVFYSPTSSGQYYYHGFTGDTTYVHVGVVTYASGMFYHVYAVTTPPAFLETLPLERSEALTEEQVMEMLRSRASDNN